MRIVRVWVARFQSDVTYHVAATSVEEATRIARKARAKQSGTKSDELNSVTLDYRPIIVEDGDGD